MGIFRGRRQNQSAPPEPFPNTAEGRYLYERYRAKQSELAAYGDHMVHYLQPGDKVTIERTDDEPNQVKVIPQGSFLYLALSSEALQQRRGRIELVWVGGSTILPHHSARRLLVNDDVLFDRSAGAES